MSEKKYIECPECPRLRSVLPEKRDGVTVGICGMTGNIVNLEPFRMKNGRMAGMSCRLFEKGVEDGRT